MTLLVSCCLCLWSCLVFRKISRSICVVSGKSSRKLDGNKFWNFFAWCLVLLRHVDIFGRLLNFLMSLLLLVLVKLSSVQKNFRKHLYSFRKVFQKTRWYFSFFTRDKNKMGDSDFGWTRLDKEDDTHVSTKEKSRYRYANLCILINMVYIYFVVRSCR